MTTIIDARASEAAAEGVSGRLFSEGVGAFHLLCVYVGRKLGLYRALADAEGLRVAVVGLGSNLLVADTGFDGLVVRLDGSLATIELDGEHIICGGGASLAAVVRRPDRAPA